MLAEPDETVIDFSASGNSGAVRATGWSGAEPTETWALGPEARLVLPAPLRQATYVLMLALRPFVAGVPLPVQRLGVTVNGIRLAEFRLAQRCVRAVRVPWDAITRAPELWIELALPDAARPCDFGEGDDDRLLGVALTLLRLYPETYDLGLTDPTARLTPAVMLAADRIALPDLMVQFESLGQHCEFGLVQRQCRAEPLGLLRFASTRLPDLLAALDARFEGMGSPASLQIELSGNGSEYMVRDRCFGFLYHAWVAAGEMAPEDIAAREMRRLPLLVRKLLAELAASRKTFVWHGMGEAAEEDAFPLAMALRRHGPNHLLFVTHADARNPAGTVAWREAGFMVGYIERFAPAENAHDFRLSQWVELCREAYRLRLALGAHPSPEAHGATSAAAMNT